MSPSLSIESLAELAQTTPERVRALAQIGLIGGGDHLFALGDVHRIRLVNAFEAAGVPAEALARASEHGAISFAYYDQLHQDPRELSARTYADLLASLADRGPMLRRIVSTIGLAEPQPSDRLSTGDEEMLLTILEVVEGNRTPDLLLRSLRVLGDFARRGSEAAIQVYVEAVARETGDLDGVPARMMMMGEQFLRPWAHYARFVPRLTGWLHERHLSTMIDSWSVDLTERLLGENGFVPIREIEPPAVSFIDLTGFTRLAEEHADRSAAEIATAFAVLAGSIAERRHGQLVKQLGDGVCCGSRTPSRESRPRWTCSTRWIRAASFQAATQEIETGPLIVREGDVFGRTVNRAARISDVARPGQLLATDTFAAGLPEDVVRREQAGVMNLQGLAEPVRLVRLWRERPRS